MDDPSLHDEEGPLWDAVTRLRRTGRPAEGLAALEAHAAADPALLDHPQARVLRALLSADLGDLRLAAGEVPEAVTLFERAVRDAPRFPDLHHRLGIARLRARDPRGARAAFDAAVALAPGFAAPRLELALLEARDGRLGESLALLKRLGETGAPAVRGEFERGMARLAEADWEGGGEALRRAFGVDGGGVDERLREIGTRVADGRSGEALALARVLLGAHPQFPDAHLALALVRRDRGEWDDCAESCGRALELHPGYHEARIYLAEALLRRGQRVEAEAQLDAVLALEPAHPLAAALAKTLRRTPLAGPRPAGPH